MISNTIRLYDKNGKRTKRGRRRNTIRLEEAFFNKGVIEKFNPSSMQFGPRSWTNILQGMTMTRSDAMDPTIANSLTNKLFGNKEG